MRKDLKFIFLLFLLSVLSLEVSAAKRYWVAANDSIWNSTTNWSATSGGAGGASVPGSSDTAYFDGGSVKNDTFDINVSIKRLEISSAYTGTIIQGTKTLTIGTSGAVLSGGTFSGGSANITASGAFIISGTAFTSTSGTFSTSANFTISSGSFTHNSGTLSLTATSTLTVSNTGGTTFYTLSFPPTVANATYTITSTTALTVSHLFSIGGNKGAVFNSGTINVTGDITNSNTAISLGGGTATIAINGTGKQTFTGTTLGDRGRLPHITINKSDTLVLLNNIFTSGNWTYTAGIINAGTSIVYFGNTTVSGSHELSNVVFYGGNTYVVASGTILTVKNTLYLGGSFLQPIINTGTIHAKGTVTLANSTSTTSGGGTATIVLNGTGTQSFIGSTIGGAARVCNIQINKPSTDTLKIINKIAVFGNWTYISGIVNSGSSQIFISGNRTISGSHTLNTLILSAYSPNPYTYTISSGTTLTLKENLLLIGNAGITVNTGTINIEKHITVSNTGTGGGGSAIIKINGAGAQTLTGNGTAGQGRLPAITIDKTGDTLTLASVISVAGNWTYTQGTVDPGTSTVVLYGTSNLDGQASGSSSMMSFYSLAIAGTISLTGNVDVNNNLSIGNGTVLSAGSNSIYLGGNWTNSGGTWTYGTGTVIFDGNTYRQIKKMVSGASVMETFYNLSFNRSGASQTLASPVTVNNVLTLTEGHVKTDTTNYLLLIDNATLVGGNDSAYVHGPVRKTGDDAFVFPLGDTTLNDTAYHPLGMSAPSVITDQFEASYFAMNYPVGDSLVDSLESVSQVEYWKLERNAGSSNVTLTLGWNRNSSNIHNVNELRVGNWNGTKWLDMGATNISAGGTLGNVTAQLTTYFVSNVAAVAFANGKYTPQYALLKKKLDGGYYHAINGRLHFQFQEEYNDNGGKLRFNIYDDHHNLVTSDQLLPALLQPAVKYGDNRYLLNTLQCDFSSVGALPDGFYILEVINDKNERWFLRFDQNSTIILAPCFVVPTGSAD